MKRMILASLLALATPVLFSAGPASAQPTPKEALSRLIAGNKVYTSGKRQATATASQREALATSQKPFAIILTCSDSRVPPELVFDKGLGELFVIRVAGNVPDPIVLGSIEYAAEHLGSPLIMVLGHERCGAVGATVAANGVPEGNIGAIVKAIMPAATRAKAEAKGKAGADVVETAVALNVHDVVAALTRDSKVLSHLVHEGKLEIVPAKYDLDTGAVELLKGKSNTHKH